MNKPFPWTCPECSECSVNRAVVPYSVTMKHENELHTVSVPDMPVLLCGNCGARMIEDEGDERLRAQLRADLNLLRSTEIRECRERLGITQQRLASLCGFAVASLSRWENGALPSRVTDRLLRVFYAIPAARDLLLNLGSNPALGTFVVWGDAAESLPSISRVYTSDPGVLPTKKAKKQSKPEDPVADHLQEEMCCRDPPLVFVLPLLSSSTIRIAI